jgi:hypothetical protein
MYKIITGCALIVLLFFTSCTEEDMDLRGTSPTIKLSFFKDAVSIKPDSVSAVGADSIHIYTDTLRTYILPLRSDQDSSEFTFYIDTLASNVTIKYTRIPIYDIDIIKHNAVFKHASANHLDSMVVQNNDILCSVAGPSDMEKLTLTCGDSLNLTTNETTLRLYY